MTVDQVSDLMRETVRVALIVSSPMLGVALVSGLIISILQAATQVNEQTLTFVPKIVLVLGTLGVLFPWMMRILIDFATSLMVQVSQRGGL